MPRPTMIIFDYGHTLLYEHNIDFLCGHEALFEHLHIQDWLELIKVLEEEW